MTTLITVEKKWVPYYSGSRLVEVMTVSGDGLPDIVSTFGDDRANAVKAAEDLLAWYQAYRPMNHYLMVVK